MKDYSTKSWKEFLVELVCMSYLFLKSYQRIAYRCIPGQSEEFSNTMLIILWLSFVVIGATFFRYERNNCSLLAVLILPVGVYAVISTYDTTWKLLVFGLLFVVVCSHVYRRCLFLNDELVIAGHKKILINRRKRYKLICFSLYILTFVSMCHIGLIVVQNVSSYGKVTKSEQYEIYDEKTKSADRSSRLPESE